MYTMQSRVIYLHATTAHSENMEQVMTKLYVHHAITVKHWYTYLHVMTATYVVWRGMEHGAGYNKALCMSTTQIPWSRVIYVYTCMQWLLKRNGTRSRLWQSIMYYVYHTVTMKQSSIRMYLNAMTAAIHYFHSEEEWNMDQVKTKHCENVYHSYHEAEWYVYVPVCNDCCYSVLSFRRWMECGAGYNYYVYNTVLMKLSDWKVLHTYLLHIVSTFIPEKMNICKQSICVPSFLCGWEYTAV